METLLGKIIVFVISTAVFYALYATFPKTREKSVIDRFYLIFALLFSMILPFLSFSYSASNPVYSVVLQTVESNALETKGQEYFPVGVNPESVMTGIYFSVALFFLIRFLFQINFVRKLKQSGSLKTIFSEKLIVSPRSISVFSYFKNIFVPEKELSNPELQKMILHEKVHVVQYHSIDATLFEIANIVFWFNPFVRQLRNALKETHEYLADTGVLEHGFDSAEYSMLLLRQSIGVQPGFANNFNKSLTFKRLKMMNTQKSAPAAKLFFPAAIVLTIAMLFAFACQNETEMKTDLKKTEIETQKSSPENIVDNPDVMPEFPGGQQAMVDFLIKNIKYPEAQKKNGIMGKVFVGFVISEQGKVSEVHVVKSDNPAFNNEALRVISSMPDWTPGKKDDKVVPVRLTLPIKFALN